jgi:hypothetical protein
MNIQRRLDYSREVITGFLRGEIDPESRPAIFEDDVLMFAVLRLERADPDWILGQLSNRAWPADLRVQILRLMRTRYAEGHAILSCEAPELLRSMRQPRS